MAPRKPRPAPRDQGPGAIAPHVIEDILGSLPLFEKLRIDEVAELSRHFSTHSLADGETFHLAGTPGAARMVVVVSGKGRLSIESPVGPLSTPFREGDAFGDLELFSGSGHATTFKAKGAVTLALLTKSGLDAILERYAAVALPLSVKMASEVHFAEDLLRQLLEMKAEGLKPEDEAVLRLGLRSRLEGHGLRLSRPSTDSLFQKLVVRKGAEAPFWMLLGFLGSLAGARLVVYLILKYGLEKKLFALVPGADPNPVHVHHFNYGLVLVGLSGLIALFPFGRRWLKILAILFGVGAGLIFDEFALFWNLNPDYHRASSLVAAAMVATLLLQFAYFRGFWVALFHKITRGLRQVRP